MWNLLKNVCFTNWYLVYDVLQANSIPEHWSWYQQTENRAGPLSGLDKLRFCWNIVVKHTSEFQAGIL